MLISKKCQYALRGVFELALREPDKPVKIQDIAEAQNIPPRFLEIILNELRKTGFVSSRRGNDGGYMLAQAAENLTVGDIIRYINGPVLMKTIHDEQKRKNGFYYGDYAFQQLWDNINIAISEVCDETSFADLIKSERTKRMTSELNYSI